MHQTITAGISKDRITTICTVCKKEIKSVEELLEECKKI